jgi:WD40 repeat protein/transcriptional regulator with XRE-family HTH domain
MGARRRYRERKFAFGTQVLAFRMRAGLTQSALAEQAGVHLRSVQNWEAGESYPKADALQRLIAVFLRHGVFSSGQERTEAQALWSLAATDGPHALATFDEEWFVHILAPPALASNTTALAAAAAPPALAVPPAPVTQPNTARPIIDWGQAIDVAALYGRESELATLRTWIVDDRCRVVALIGLGGIGKSSLALRAVHIMESAFDRVLFRSLQNGPPLAEVIDQIIRAVSEQQSVPPDQVVDKIALLVQLFREQRCLLILDNFESVMQGGALTGSYRSGYDSYGALLHAFGDRSHRSCLLLTSREKPAELGKLEGRSTPVRTLSIGGLDDTACQRLLEAKDIVGTTGAVQALAHLYGGNPLALALVSEPIHELFDGNVQAFLDTGEAFFNGVGMLLEQQFARSTAIEQAVLRWLAIEREVVTLDMLLECLRGVVSRAELIAVLESLRRRLLIERTPGRAGFTLQPVILEFVTERLVEAIHNELVEGPPKLLCSHALVQATAKDYVRHSQEQLIARPLLERLTGAPGDAVVLERQLLVLLEGWRERPRSEQGYGPGNVINLLRLLRGELRGLDLARLTIRQAYLAEVDAQDARLVDAELADTVLAEAFHFPGSVALSGDGTLLAVGTSTGQVWLWRTADRTSLWTVQGHISGIWGLALSSDGQLVASGGEDGMVRLWEASSGRSLAILSGHTGSVGGMALSADGRLVVSGSLDGTVRLWEASSGRALATLPGHTGGVRGVALSSDDRLLASGGEDGMVRLWEASSGRALATLQGQAGVIRCVALSSDGRLLASGGEDGIVRLWEASSGQLLATLSGHAGAVWCVALSSDGRLLASGSIDGTVRLWDTSSGRPLATLPGHAGAVWCVALSSDGRLLASGGGDGMVKLWEASSARALATLQGQTGAVWCVALSSDGQLVASGSIDGMVKLWEASSGQLLATLQGHTSAVRGVALSSDGRLLASGGEDGMVRLWQAGSAQLLTTLRGHAGAVWCVVLSSDGRLVVSGGLDGTVRLWDASSGRALATLSGHTGGIRCVALSSDGRLLASGGEDGMVWLWEASSGRTLATLSGHTGGIRCVALSSDGRLVVSGGLDGTVRLWDASSGRALAILSGHTGGVWCVALSSDGRLVVSGGLDGTVRLWDASSGRALATLQDHTGPIRGVALSSDGRLVVSGSFDGTVRLWEAESGASLRTLRAELRYERMDITGLLGITEAQRASLIALGAVERLPQ